MSVDENTIEGFAKALHFYQIALAPGFGAGPSRERAWRILPDDEQERLMAAARLALADVQPGHLGSNGNEPNLATGTEGREGREWGC
jgi:hypothetical protein